MAAKKQLSDMTIDELKSRYKGMRMVTFSILGIFATLFAIMLGMYFTGNWRGTLATIAAPVVTMAATGTIFFSQIATVKKEMDRRLQQ